MLASRRARSTARSRGRRNRRLASARRRDRPLDRQPARRADGAGTDISGPLPAQRFDADALAKVAAASVTVRCECPHHLVDLISTLNAFETYSQECEVLKVDDAALHVFLDSATAQARALMEAALARVMDSDAIEIEDED